MAKPTAQQCHAMTTYYMNAWREKYKREPSVNRNTARWAWEGMLMDMPPAEVKKLVDFYFSTKSERLHALDWFFYNYEKLESAMVQLDLDRQRRERMREESAKRAEEWRARGNKGIGGN